MKLLKDRYDERFIKHAHLQAIMEFPEIRQESTEQLNKLTACFLENYMAHSTLRLKVDECDPIWIYTITKELDPETRRQWEVHCSRDETQSMKDLCKFLASRSRALAAAKPRRYLLSTRCQGEKKTC